MGRTWHLLLWIHICHFPNMIFEMLVEYPIVCFHIGRIPVRVISNKLGILFCTIVVTLSVDLMRVKI